MTYSLAGDRENELEKFVGQRVEIVGTLSASEAGSASGSAAAESRNPDSRREDADDASRAPVTRPEGSSAGDANRGNAGSPGASASQAHAQRLNIVSFRPIGGQCS